IPVVWLSPVLAGPEPASLRLAARPVSQGPASDAPVLNTRIEQPATTSCFIFICLSRSSWRTHELMGGNRPVAVRFRVARQIRACLIFAGAFLVRTYRWNRFAEG